MTVSDFLAELVVNTSGDELSEGANERNLAGDGETSSNTYHIGLGDAALDESLRELLGECAHLQRALQVCCKGKNPFVLTSGDCKSLTETAAGVFFTCIDIFLHNACRFKILIITKGFGKLGKSGLALFG